MTSNAAGTTEERPKRRTATVNLPFVRAEFRAPELHLPSIPTPPVPGRDEVTAALHTARSFLPPPRQLAYYGALGVLAAVELIEWPVAVAIGVGTAVAGLGREAPKTKPAEQPKALEEATPAEPAKPIPAAEPTAQAAPAVPAQQTRGTARPKPGERARPQTAGQPVPAGSPRPAGQRTKPPAGRNKPGQKRNGPPSPGT